MINRKSIFLFIFLLGIGLLQATLSEAVCTSPPVISEQPVDASVVLSDSTSFTLTADAGGEPLTYQWQKDSIDITDGGSITGATTNNLAISSVIGADDGDYTCIVTCDDGGAGLSTTTDIATLAVQMQLSFLVDGDGATDLHSSVVSDPAGIDCGGLTNDCDEYYRYNTSVTLTATPDPRSTVTWGGDCVGETTNTCTLTMDNIRNAGATFTLQTNELNGTVTDQQGDPLTGAKIYIDDGLDWTPPIAPATTIADGTYSFPNLYIGTYSVTAIKFLYHTTTFTDVVVSPSPSPATTQDFQLEEATIYTLNGKITDTNTGWPLYAEINWEYGYDVNFFGTSWTDPVTGEYSIDLPEGEYAVAASADGYTTIILPVDVTTSNATQDYALSPDTTTCTAQGYKWAGVGLTENFNSCAPPTGWEITINGGDCKWEVSDPDPGTTGNNTGGTGCFADADGLACGVDIGTTMNTEMITPMINGSLLGSPILLSFKTDFSTKNNSKPAVLRVDVSNDGGSTWTGSIDPTIQGTSLFFRNTNLQGPQSEEIDISGYAVGHSFVKIRFTYTFEGNGSDGSWAQIDDVEVYNPTCVTPTTGGIVVGNVYDENTALGLNDALVDNGGVNSSFDNSVFTVSTKGDGNLDEGFYSMYLENAGAVALTATMDKYGPSTETPNVPLLDVIRQDFYLPAGELSADPDAIEVHIAPDTTLSLPLSIINSGNASADYEIFERYYPAPPTPGVNQENPLGPALMKSAYAVDISDTQDDSLVVFPEVGTPGTMDVIATNASTKYASGDFLDGDYSKIYVLDNQSNRLVTLSISDGASTEIGQPSKSSGELWTGMTYDDTNNILYASSSDCGTSSTLYTINPANGASTIIGTITNANCIMDLAIDSTGTFLYGVDVETDHLYSINITTGFGTDIGALGIDTSLEQGLDFDDTDTLYWASYNEITGGEGEMRTINVATGESTLIETFPAGTHIDCLAFTTDYLGEIPWLTPDPTSGTVDIASSQLTTLNFDSTGLTAGTTETGFLSVSTTTPYGTFNIPITLVVEPNQTLNVTVDNYGAVEPNVIASSGLVDCPGTCSDTYPYNTQLSLTASVTSGAFLGWAGGCSGTDLVCNLTMNQPQDITATFYDPADFPGQQVLGVGISGSGAGSVASAPAGVSCGDGATDCLAGFSDGVSVTLTATEGTSSIFMGWAGDCSGNDTTCTVLMDQVRYVSATFTDTTSTNELAVNLPGSGSGAVTSSPVGIFCGTAGQTCTAVFDNVATVTLTAAPEVGTTFSGWTGDCSGSNPICTLSMDQARNVAALFSLNSYELTVIRDGLGSGTVTSNPVGINCGSDCAEYYDYGSQVVLTAVPDKGSAIGEWQGNCNETSLTSPTCTVDISQTESVTITFDPSFPWSLFLPSTTGMGTK